MSYLDIVRSAKDKFHLPIIAYNVSGEYMALHTLIEKGLAAEEIIYEVMISIKRAGADRIITYHTPYLLENIDAFRSF